MMNKKINCSILTPERTLYEGDVDMVVVQAHDGEMGFMSGHSPLISELGIGEIRLKNANSTEYFVIEGGIVEVRNNKIIILAENALKKEELDREDLQKRMNAIVVRKGQASKSKERFEIQMEQIKLKARLKIALK
jgi:F-type H+-transporting ATPase subunit epsilon